MTPIKDRLYRLLRWSERYTKTDMVYLASSGFWINLNFIFTSILAFLLSIAFANLLTKTEYGTYQYILSVFSILTAFTFTGFNTAITQSVARGYEGTLRASIRPQLLWNLVPAAAALAWSAYYLFLGQTMLGVGILFVFLSLPIVNTFNSYSAYLNGKQKFKKNSLYLVVNNTAYYFLMFCGIWFFPSALPLVFINLVVTTATATYSYVRVLRTEHPNEKNDPGASSYARHLSAMNVLGTISAQIDSILIFHFIGAADLAVYSIARLLPEKSGSLLKSVTFAAAVPRFSERTFDDIRGNITRRLLLLSFGVFVIIGMYAMLSPLLFNLFYPKYAASVSYSQMYALTLVSYLGGFITSIFLAQRKLAQLYFLNTALPILQILAQIAGIIFWGLWGLIAAKIIAASISSAAAIILMYREKAAD